MPLNDKLVLTAAVLMGVAVFWRFVDRGDGGPTDSFLWKGGPNDPIRLLIMRPDGTFRKTRSRC
jgi:hypothetical protein